MDEEQGLLERIIKKTSGAYSWTRSFLFDFGHDYRSLWRGALISALGYPGFGAYSLLMGAGVALMSHANIIKPPGEIKRIEQKQGRKKRNLIKMHY